MPTIDLGPVIGPPGKQGADGPEGKQSIQGEPGPAATINGLPAITISAGENVDLKQEDGDLKINCTASNHDILINSDFRNPVNRNMIQSGELWGAQKYGIDMWRAYYSDSVKWVNGEGIWLIERESGYGIIDQGIDTSAVREGMWTFWPLCRG